MTPDEPLQSTETPAPADDLRGDIEKAFAADQTAQEPAPQGTDGQPLAREPAVEMSVPGERARDAQGRFVAQPQQPEIASQAQAAADAAAQVAAQQRPQGAVPAQVQGPPPGWSVPGKAAYAGLPDVVKADIAKREMEMSQGLAKLAEFKALDPYVEMARNARTTLDQALARYVKAEQTLETDPVSGMLWLAQTYKVDPVQLMYGLCQMNNIHPLQLVQALGGDAPHQPGGEPPQSYQLDPQTQQQLQAMQERLAYMEQERERAEDQSINGQIAAFASNPENKYFENVRHIMAHIIRTAPRDQNLTLSQVYEDACWNHPEVREQLISERSRNAKPVNPQNPAINGRARVSLPSGSPIAGGTLARNEPKATLREEIEAAFEEHGGEV